MQIKRIKAHNYKTYVDLDLDLSVLDPERPIILIGGKNGGGKTTLFEAIYGALYGLNIQSHRAFDELLNNGAVGVEKPEIQLEITFSGYVLGQEKIYRLRRRYTKREDNNPPVVESVELNMDGDRFIYGTFTAAKQRQESEQLVNKIIKANLPQELSRYFLFDAMQSRELLQNEVFAQLIRDNIENVMGFKKYNLLQKASEHVQQNRAAERLHAEQEAAAYNKLCEEKKQLEDSLKENQAEQDRLGRLLIDSKADYDKAKAGADKSESLQQQINQLAEEIKSITTSVTIYYKELKNYCESFELNVVLPQLAGALAIDIENILRAKERLRKDADGNYSLATVKDLTAKIIGYLRDFNLCSADVEEENVVSHVMSMQTATTAADPYSYLDDTEVAALRDLLNRNGASFVVLDKMRTELNQKLGGLKNLEIRKESLERTQVGGDAVLIEQYDGWDKALKEAKLAEVQIKRDIQDKAERISMYDIQVQQEPDVKYDTLVKLVPFFKDVAEALLETKKERIEKEMQEQLNMLLTSYKGYIARVELNFHDDQFEMNLYHKQGNRIALSQLNAASKQIFIQVLLKVLRNLGEYNPPVMIDTVMGVLDEDSRDLLMEKYFPDLAEQTILLCTTSEIRKDSDYIKLEPFISRTYTLVRDAEHQCTHVENDYFGLPLND